MTEERTENYRDVLEELARSRGLSGAEELARRVVEVDPDYTERDILEAGVGGFGDALDKVLDMTEDEKVRTVRALAGARSRAEALGICSVPGCGRPAASETGMTVCQEHRRAFDAQAEEEDWDVALSILRPWVEATEPIAVDSLTRVMKGALAEAEGQRIRVRAEREAAKAALSESSAEAGGEASGV